MQNSYSIDEILTPLALTVIIDNKVRDPELPEYIIQAIGLLELLGHGDKLKAPNILDWFRENEMILVARIKSARKNTFVLTTLIRFKDDDIAIKAVYGSMLTISISDKEYHMHESDLIISAASLWGYERPPFKIFVHH